MWNTLAAGGAVCLCCLLLGCAGGGPGHVEPDVPVEGSEAVESIEHARDDIQIMYCWGVQGRNRLDTITGTITKDLVSAGTITVPFELTAEQRKMIVDYADSIKFWRLPSRVVLPDSVELVEMQHPHTEHILVIWDSSRQKSVSWDTRVRNPIAERDKVAPLGAMIRKIVVESEVYKALPEFKGGYL